MNISFHISKFGYYYYIIHDVSEAPADIEDTLRIKLTGRFNSIRFNRQGCFNFSDEADEAVFLLWSSAVRGYNMTTKNVDTI
jgi:hypothetical protein